MGKTTTRPAGTGQFRVPTAAGRSVVIKGAGSLRASELKIMRGVDLTKPIARQVMRDGPTGASKKG